jgi:cell division protein FtsQ
MARESKKAESQLKRRLKHALGIFLAFVLVSSVVVWRLRHYALNSRQFHLSSDHRDALTIQGWQYAPHYKVRRIFASDFDRSVFSVPLAERRRRLLAIDWVEDASVSRVWPDRLEVRIRERQPVAFVFFPSGVYLIDSQGVLLETPSQSHFAFPVLRGVREDESEPQRKERVRALLRVQEDLGTLASDVSEVNAADPDNIRMVVQPDHRPVELILGNENFLARYQNFVKNYPEIQKRTPGAKVFDLRLDDLITAKE